MSARHHWIPRHPDDDGPLPANTPPIDLSNILGENLEKIRAAFERIFRRPPGKGDPLFFPFQLLMSEDDVADGMAVLMDVAGIDPAIKYATQKTGRIVSEQNQQFLTDAEIDEWNDAIDEFEAQKEAGFPEPFPTPYDLACEQIEEEFGRLPFVISLFVRQAHVPKRNHDINRDVAFFYLTKTLKTLQACDALTELHYGEDAMCLARSIFENYLQLTYLVRKPVEHADWVHAHFGILSGTHEYGVSKKGKVLYNTLIDKSTGKAVSPVSRSEMAGTSPFDEDRKLYTLLYNVLSSYSHPDPVLLTNYVTPNGFDAAQRVDSQQAHALAYFLAALNLDAMLHLQNHPRRPRRDAQVLLSNIRIRAATVFKEMRTSSEIIPPLRDRVAKIGQRWNDST